MTVGPLTKGEEASIRGMLPADMRKRLRLACVDRGITMQDGLLEALELWLDTVDEEARRDRGEV